MVLDYSPAIGLLIKPSISSLRRERDGQSKEWGAVEDDQHFIRPDEGD